MTFIDEIKNWCDSEGYTFRYGNPMQLEEMLGRVDFAASKDSTVVFCHLVTAMEWRNGRDRHTIGVYFARLCPFDFDGMQVLAQQEEMKDAAKSWLRSISCGNTMCWEDARFTFGYDDFCENVAWVCCRVTLWPAYDECVPMCNAPEPPEPQEDFAEVLQMLVFLADNMFAEWSELCELAVWGIDDIGDEFVYFAFVTHQQAQFGDLLVYINGTREDEWFYEEITSEVVEFIPALAPYLGWYAVIGIEYCSGIPVGHGDTVTVDVQYQGDTVLSCSGQIPE